MFERLPLVDENYDKQPIAPSTKEKVLEFIIEDLKFAKENCKEFDKKELVNSQKTPSKEAAIVLLARVYRIAGDIQAVGKEAELLLSGGKLVEAPEAAPGRRRRSRCSAVGPGCPRTGLRTP